MKNDHVFYRKKCQILKCRKKKKSPKISEIVMGFRNRFLLSRVIITFLDSMQETGFSIRIALCPLRMTQKWVTLTLTARASLYGFMSSKYQIRAQRLPNYCSPFHSSWSKLELQILYLGLVQNTTCPGNLNKVPVMSPELTKVFASFS